MRKNQQSSVIVLNDDVSLSDVPINRRSLMKKGIKYTGLSVLQMIGVGSISTKAYSLDSNFDFDPTYLYTQAEINRTLVLGSLRTLTNQALAEALVAETEDLSPYKAAFDGPPRDATWVDEDFVSFMVGFSYHFLEGSGFLGRLYLVASCHYDIVYVKKITGSSASAKIKELYLYCLGTSSEAKGTVWALEKNFTDAAFNGVETAAAILDIYRTFIFTNVASIGAYARPASFSATESAKCVNRFNNMPLENINILKMHKDIRWNRVMTFMRIAAGVPAFLKFKANAIRAERLDDSRRLSRGKDSDDVLPYKYRDSRGQIIESKTQLVLRPGNLRGYTERVDLAQTNSFIDSMLWGPEYSETSINRNGTYPRYKLEYDYNQYWKIESNRTQNDYADAFLFDYYQNEDYAAFGDFDLTKRIGSNETTMRALAKNIHRSLAETTADPYASQILASMGIRVISMLDITALRFCLDDKTLDLGAMGTQLQEWMQNNSYIKSILKTDGAGFLLGGISLLVGSALAQFALQAIIMHNVKSVRKEMIRSGKKPTLQQEVNLVRERIKTGLSPVNLASTLTAAGLLGAAGLGYPDSMLKGKAKIFAGYAFGAADFTQSITGIVSYERSKKSSSDKLSMYGDVFRFVSGCITSVEASMRFVRSRAEQRSFSNTPTVYQPLKVTKWTAAASTVLYFAAFIVAGVQ